MATLRAMVLFIPFTLQAQECDSQLINWNDYDRTLINLRGAYHKENYASVEKALDCLMNSEKTFTSGKPGSVAAYWFYRGEMPGSGADEMDALRVKRWKESVKDSPYAHFAGLRLLYSQAWNARGTRYENETSENQIERFNERLVLAEKAILSEANTLKETAISYNLLMAVSLDTRSTETSPAAVFEAGVSRWPNYYDFYEVFLTRLVPKWGGSWDLVDAFINNWSEKLQELESNSLYARLYYNVHMHNRVNPHDTQVEWAKLKPSLISLYTKYPANIHYEIAASYSCIFSDHEFYRQLISENKIVSSKAWLSGSSIERCDEYFEKLSDRFQIGA